MEHSVHCDCSCRICRHQRILYLFHSFQWRETLEIEMAKIALSGSQALTVLGRYPLRWPKAVSDIFSVAGGLFSGAGDVISFTCAMSNADGSRYIRGSAVILGAPLIAVACAALFWLVKAILSSGTERKHIHSNFIVSVMVILFMILPSLNQTYFSCSHAVRWRRTV